MPVPRPIAMVPVKLLAKLLDGTGQCTWAAWFQSHHSEFDRVPDNFDGHRWNIDHAALLTRTADKLESNGYSVLLEKQNRFEFGKEDGVKLVGKPDIIAIKDGHGLIIDVKTGNPKKCHRRSTSREVNLFSTLAQVGREPLCLVAEICFCPFCGDTIETSRVK